MNPKSSDDRERILNIINDIVENADERFYGEWRGQEYPVLFHQKEKDVVLESQNGEFITLRRETLRMTGLKTNEGKKFEKFF